MWLLLIKCSLRDFYSKICISSIFTWPYVQYGYSLINRIKFQIMQKLRWWNINNRIWITVYDGLTLCWCGLCAGVVSTELWWISDSMTCRLVTMANVFSGLKSTFCSSICVWFFLVGKYVCKMTPNISYCFLCCTVFSSCMVWSAFPY